MPLKDTAHVSLIQTAQVTLNPPLDKPLQGSYKEWMHSFTVAAAGRECFTIAAAYQFRRKHIRFTSPRNKRCAEKLALKSCAQLIHPRRPFFPLPRARQAQNLIGARTAAPPTCTLCCACPFPQNCSGEFGIARCVLNIKQGNSICTDGRHCDSGVELPNALAVQT